MKITLQNVVFIVTGSCQEDSVKSAQPGGIYERQRQEAYRKIKVRQRRRNKPTKQRFMVMTSAPFSRLYIITTAHHFWELTLAARRLSSCCRYSLFCVLATVLSSIATLSPGKLEGLQRDTEAISSSLPLDCERVCLIKDKKDTFMN